MAEAKDKDKNRNGIRDVAVLAGHFSVWMTVFADDAQMKLLLIQAFNNTAKNCFDELGRPINRSGGKI
jgi:hypothetical protein